MNLFSRKRPRPRRFYLGRARHSTGNARLVRQRRSVASKEDIRVGNTEALRRRRRRRLETVTPEGANKKGTVARRWAPFLAFAFVGSLALVAALPANAEFQTTAAPVAPSKGQEVRGSAAQAVASRDAISSVLTSNRKPGGTNYINNPNSIIQWPFHETWPFGDMYGPRETGCSVCSSFEYGIDIMAPEGTTILSIADGVVSDVHPANDNGYGVHVTVNHVINGEVFQSNYNHMLENSIVVQVGQQVKLGDALGQVGNTGNSTAPHTCFLILIGGTPVDPYAWLISHNV
jgi:murein DD-endopeptidase MepM/ murein hydrolase activator NlpD